jgi:cyanophycin synthetase
MIYSLSTSRILYQTSKYAPVAVVRLELDESGGVMPEATPAVVGSYLNGIIAGYTGEALTLSGSESPLDVYCELALLLQRSAGHDVAYSRLEVRDTTPRYRVFIEYEDHATALYAGDLALDLLNAALVAHPGADAAVTAELHRQLEDFIVYALARRLDPNTRLLKEAARQRGIPVLSLDQLWAAPAWPGAADRSGVVQYGWGVNQRQCRAALPLGVLSSGQLRQCMDRAELLPRLIEAGLPVAVQDLEFINRNQVRRAQRSAARIGYPVILRPRMAALPQYGLLDGGVFGPLESDEQVSVAASYLRDQARADVWVESFVKGDHFRFLILENEVVSILRFDPPSVVGDGVHSIAELTRTRVNAARDGDTHRTWQDLAHGDGSLLCRLRLQGMSPSSIPATGEVVPLRDHGSQYNGGAAVETIDQVPSRFTEVALRAAVAAGAGQVIGVDMIIGDLQQGADMPNCAVTGVDPAPDLVAHSKMSESNLQRIPAKFLSLLFPHGKPSRIPSVSVTGTNGKTTTSRMVTRILRESGLKVGLTCSDGIYLDGEHLVRNDKAGVMGGFGVLANERMEAAVLETARGGMANTGIVFDRVDVGVCLNVAEDHLGDEEIDTVEQMAVHKRQVIERSSRAAVLNAEDAHCLAMREHTNAEEVILFASDPDHPAITAHIGGGGRAVVLDDIDGNPGIVLRQAQDQVTPVIIISDIPAAEGGAAFHNVLNALAATGVAFGLGVATEHITSGLKKFVLGVGTTPGRLNWIPGFSFDVLVDAAHNPHGMRKLLDYVKQHGDYGCKTIVFSVRVAMPRWIIRRYVELIAGNFDRYIVRNYRHDVSPDPEAEKNTLQALTSELTDQGVAESAIIVEPDGLKAVDLGIEASRSGDLLVVQVPAGGATKWDMIDRIKASERRGDAEVLKAQAVDLVRSGPLDSDLKLFFAGDVMLGRGIDQVLPSPCNPRLYEHWRNITDAREFVRRAQQKHGEIDSERDIAYVWGDALADLTAFAPDLKLINLETALTTHDRHWPGKRIHYRMNPQNIGVLQHAAIDFCALANNHVLDWDRAGLAETIRTLDEVGIRHAGGGANQAESESAAIFKVPGKGRVIVLSMGTRSSGIPLEWGAGHDRPGINLVDLKDARVDEIRERLAHFTQPGDIKIVSIHWGGNYEAVIPQDQREFARELIERAGVDVVHGHSSHHVRGIEVYNDKLILYGCGDLVNDYEANEKPPEVRKLAPDLGLMYFVRISPETGYLTDLQMIPTKMRRLRVTRGDADDADRLTAVLNRECIELGTVVVNEGGTLRLKIMKR